jgi:hypothetical protein
MHAGTPIWLIESAFSVIGLAAYLHQVLVPSQTLCGIVLLM